MTFTPLFGTGFEMGTTLILGYAKDSVTTSSPTPKTGSYCAYIRDFGDNTFNLPTTGSDLYFNLWFQRTTTSNQIGVVLGDGKKIYIALTDPLTYYVDGTLVGTGTHAVNASQWYNLRFHIVSADSGSFEVRLDGVTDLNYSGDTKPGTSTTISKFYLNLSITAGNAVWLDDFTYGSGGWPEDIRYTLLKPTADTAQKDFSRSTGSDNYALVDEVPPSATDYVYSSTNGHKDFYDITDFNASVTGNTLIPLFTIQWVQAWKAEVNTQQFKFMQKLGATEYASDAKDVSATAAMYWDLRATDPAGAAWTDANLDSLQIGQQAVI